MDSLSLYQTICDRVSYGRVNKLEEVDRLIQCIYAEILNPPIIFENSPFLAETIRILDSIRSGIYDNRSFISTVDMFVVVQGLWAYIQPQLVYFSSQYISYLFNGSRFTGDELQKVEEILDILDRIKQELEPQIATRNDPETIAGIDTQAMIDPVENFRKKQSRAEENQEIIKQWHENQTNINSVLLRMQPDVSKLLTDFMEFSNKTTEAYVLQFANMQIRLYNLICDTFSYHKQKVEVSKDVDYQNAVLNYEDFLLDILDGLAAFGVEEIVSECGTLFDGSIHAVDDVNFSPRNAVIIGSVRTGFKYKDLILQKEKVLIEERNFV